MSSSRLCVRLIVLFVLYCVFEAAAVLDEEYKLSEKEREMIAEELAGCSSQARSVVFWKKMKRRFDEESIRERNLGYSHSFKHRRSPYDIALRANEEVIELVPQYVLDILKNSKESTESGDKGSGEGSSNPEGKRKRDPSGKNEPPGKKGFNLKL